MIKNKVIELLLIINIVEKKTIDFHLSEGWVEDESVSKLVFNCTEETVDHVTDKIK